MPHLKPIWNDALVSMVFVIVGGVAVAATSYAFGGHGFGISLYSVAGCWYVLAHRPNTILSRISKTRPTQLEFVVVLAICGILHGLALPAVTTNCEGRRSSVTATLPETSQVQGVD